VGVGAGVGTRAVVPERREPLAAVSGRQRQRGSELGVRAGGRAESPASGDEPAAHCGKREGGQGGDEASPSNQTHHQAAKKRAPERELSRNRG